jgi:hypothetical protein
MKALKEPLARLANHEDGCRGTFWEKRFHSIAILDEEALLATCAYIDLNPMAAGLCPTPESGPHTSVRQRVDHVRRQGKMSSLKSARDGSVSGSRSSGTLDQDHWLVPMDDRRGKRRGGGGREGLLATFSLGSYLMLLDYTGRLCRTGKARMGSEVKEVFERLGTSDASWSARLGSMLSSRELRGNFFAADRRLIAAHGAKRGKRTANLSPQAPKPQSPAAGQ